MKRHHRLIIVSIAVIVYVIWIFQGVGQVPFHPDESSLLYQSRDFETWLTEPLSLAWDSSKLEDYDQQYRALNAPLIKYVLGIGRRLAGYGPDAVSTDWDWSKSWQDNRASGALPSETLLRASRLSITLLLPFSLLLIFYSGAAVRSKRMGYVAAVLLSMNALVLLHNRRAMAEGVLNFGVCLAILGMLEADRKPWLAAFGAALAVLAKYSSAAMLLVNFLACVWIPSKESSKKRQILRNIIIYIIVATITILILSPIVWIHPLQAVTQIWNARQEFLAKQINTLRYLQPTQVLDTLPMRFAVMLGHLYLTPLQFEEVGNYQTQIESMSMIYLVNPLHDLFRHPIGAGFLLFLTILGTVTGIRHFVTTREKWMKRKYGLLILSSLLMLVTLLISIPLPYQRYWIPMVPFLCLWIAYGIEEILQLIKTTGRPTIRRPV